MISVLSILVVVVGMVFFAVVFMKIYKDEVDSIAKSGLSTEPFKEVSLNGDQIRRSLRQIYSAQYQYYRDTGNMIYIRQMPKRGHKGGLFVVELKNIVDGRTALGIGGRMIGKSQTDPSETDALEFREMLNQRLEAKKDSPKMAMLRN